MAYPRALRTISRWHGLTSGLVLGPFKASMIRLNSTDSPRLPSGAIWVSAFEKAMHDLYGDQWKEKLSRDGKRFVRAKERGRQIRSKAVADGTHTLLPGKQSPDDYDLDRWHKRVQELKARILIDGTDTRITQEATAEAQKAHPQEIEELKALNLPKGNGDRVTPEAAAEAQKAQNQESQDLHPQEQSLPVQG